MSRLKYLLTSIVVLLTYSPLLLLLALLYRLARIRAFRSFPLFFVYVCYAIVAGVARFCVRNDHEVYFFLYWATDAGYALLGILVFYEVLVATLQSVRTTIWFRILTPALVTLASVLTFLYWREHPPQVDEPIIGTILLSEFWVRLLQAFLFMAVVFLRQIFTLHWRRHVFGIVAGFGFYATVYLSITAFFRFFGTTFTTFWGSIELGAYTIAVIVWLWYFWRPDRDAPPGQYPGGLRSALADVEHYKEIIKKVPRHPPS